VTLFVDRPISALIVIDVQVGVVHDAWRRNEIVANISEVVAHARETNMPVIWVQHSDDWMAIGSDKWAIVPELQPLENETKIQKNYCSSFEATNLEEVLADINVGHLVICGAQTNNCVRHTIHAALERGYDITLVEDAHSTSDGDWDNGTLRAADIIDDQNRSCAGYQLPGRCASLITTRDLVGDN
jgi:nicotinamidase-related amidase